MIKDREVKVEAERKRIRKAQQQFGVIKIKCILMVGDKSCGKPRKPIEHFTEKHTQITKAPSGISNTHTHPSVGLLDKNAC